MTDDEKEKGFVIKDKRVLHEDQAGSDSPEDAPENLQESGVDDALDDLPLPQINFATFVASLNASALVNLGVIADPATGTTEKNLPIAKQTIDIMSMLQEKTKGNLTVDEESILKSILYDLKMMYVREKG